MTNDVSADVEVVTQTASELMEMQLQNELAARLEKRSDEAKGSSFITIILPIIVEALQALLQRCNQTPTTAARTLKKMSPWTQANIRRQIRQRDELLTVQTEVNESIKAVVQRSTEATLVQVLEEEKDDRIEWSLI